MSGGYWDYANDTLWDSMFHDAVYDEELDEYVEVDSPDPLCDPLLSELLYDMFQLMHDCDWMLSGDTCEETYEKQNNAFKDKWGNRIQAERDIRAYEEAVRDSDSLDKNTKFCYNIITGEKGE